MNLNNQQLISLIKNSVISGTFGVISFICFFFTYGSLKPELKIFLNFFDSGNIDGWAYYNIFDTKSFLLTIGLLVTCAMLATIGLIAAIFAKSFHDKAVEALKGEIVT